MASPQRLAKVACLGASLSLLVVACGDKFPKNFDADRKSGPDGKRSGAQILKINKAKTDEVSYAQQDRTDWYVVTLKGQPGVLATEIHWDNAKSDLMVDVFDEFGKQLTASPTRAPGTTQKVLLSQIEHPGAYYIRISAPKPEDGSVYTMEAKWDSQEVAEVTPPPPDPVPVPPPPRDPPPRPRKRDPEPKPEKPEKAMETIQGHIVSAYLESGQMTLHIDKGSSAGVRVGMSGTILSGANAEDPLPGGGFKIVQVLDGTKSVGKCSLRSIGKNTRVAITVR